MAALGRGGEGGHARVRAAEGCVAAHTFWTGRHASMARRSSARHWRYSARAAEDGAPGVAPELWCSASAAVKRASASSCAMPKGRVGGGLWRRQAAWRRSRKAALRGSDA